MAAFNTLRRTLHSMKLEEPRPLPDAGLFEARIRSIGSNNDATGIVTHWTSPARAVRSVPFSVTDGIYGFLQAYREGRLDISEPPKKPRHSLHDRMRKILTVKASTQGEATPASTERVATAPTTTAVGGMTDIKMGDILITMQTQKMRRLER